MWNIQRFWFLAVRWDSRWMLGLFQVENGLVVNVHPGVQKGCVQCFLLEDIAHKRQCFPCCFQRWYPTGIQSYRPWLWIKAWNFAETLSDIIIPPLFSPHPRNLQPGPAARHPVGRVLPHFETEFGRSPVHLQGICHVAFARDLPSSMVAQAFLDVHWSL